MLLIETRHSSYVLDSAARQLILDSLEEKGLIPLIRRSRQSLFEQLSSGLGGHRTFERTLSDQADKTGDAPYFKGDLFCFQDHALIVMFGDSAESGISAGIAYQPTCFEPGRKLDVFCRNIQDALSLPSEDGQGGSRAAFPGWQTLSKPSIDERPEPADEPSVTTAIRATVADRARLMGVLDEPSARRFLQHICEAYADGRMVELLTRAGPETATGPLVWRLAEASLLRREILVSCRKRNRPLFRLPSPEALAQITTSDAICSECGAKLADEKFDELIIPTEAASTLLNDGSWLAGRIRAIVRTLGIPDANVSVPHANSEDQLMSITVDVAGEVFLLALFDGDVSAIDSRRISLEANERGASNLIVVSTGRIHEDARGRLREHARHRGMQRQSLNITLLEGLDGITETLAEQFEKASEKGLISALFPLDSSLGFSAGRLIAIRFRLSVAEAPGILSEPASEVMEPAMSAYDTF
jgi:hypothetical protein